jgi:hypothetical protein
MRRQLAVDPTVPLDHLRLVLVRATGDAAIAEQQPGR